MKNQISTIAISIAVILGCYILGNSYLQSKREPSKIAVTGLASRDFGSDMIVWSAGFSRRAFDLQEAFNALKADQARVKSYLTGKGISANEIVFSAVDIGKEIITFDIVAIAILLCFISKPVCCITMAVPRCTNFRLLNCISTILLPRTLPS